MFIIRDKFLNKKNLFLSIALLFSMDFLAVSAMQAGRKYDFTLLHLAAWAGDEQKVKCLLTRGIDVNISDKDGKTALLCSCLRFEKENTIEKCLAVAKLLLEHNANPNLTDKDGKSPLCVAVSHGDVSLVELLLSYGADPNFFYEGNWPLYLAVVKGDVHMVKLLLSCGAAIIIPDKNYLELLPIAVCEGFLEIIQILLDAGVDVNSIYKGRTALHCVKKGQRRAVVELLLAYGADPEHVITKTGETPLMRAQRHGYDDVAAVLMRAYSSIMH